MKIQMVFQDAHDSLNPRYTARDAIGEPLIRLLKLKDKQKLDARINELAEQVGLPQSLAEPFPPSTLGWAEGARRHRARD
jgi:peptide/nickel transport system ATP-binding protein